MRRCGRSPSAASSGLLTGSVCRPRRLGSRLVLGSLLAAFCGRRGRDLAGLPDGVEVARDYGAFVVRDAVLLRAAHEDSGDRHAPSRDRDVPVDDELTRLTRREGEALEERERLEAPRQDRLDVEREDVIERRAFERQESEAAESPEQLFPLLLRLLVPGPNARLEFSGPLPKAPQNVLGAPQLLLVLQPVLLQEFVLRLDALGLPRMVRPLDRVRCPRTFWPVSWRTPLYDRIIFIRLMSSRSRTSTSAPTRCRSSPDSQSFGRFTIQGGKSSPSLLRVASILSVCSSDRLPRRSARGTPARSATASDTRIPTPEIAVRAYPTERVPSRSVFAIRTM